MSTFEQRANIKFCELLGKSAAETLEMLRRAHGDQALSATAVFAWHRQFREGRQVSADVNNIKEEQEEQPVSKKKRGGGKSQKESREAPSDEEDNKESGEVNSVKEEQEEQPVVKKKQGAEKSQKVSREAPSDEEDNTAEH